MWLVLFTLSIIAFVWVLLVVSVFLCVGRFFVFSFFDLYDVESGSKLDGELRRRSDVALASNGAFAPVIATDPPFSVVFTV
jgi:hypothetical protein